MRRRRRKWRASVDLRDPHLDYEQAETLRRVGAQLDTLIEKGGRMRTHPFTLAKVVPARTCETRGLLVRCVVVDTSGAAAGDRRDGRPLPAGPGRESFGVTFDSSVPCRACLSFTARDSRVVLTGVPPPVRSTACESHPHLWFLRLRTADAW